MMKLSLLLLFQFFCIERVTSICHEYYAGLVPAMNGRIRDYAHIDKTQVHSLQDCFELCFLNTSCVTFFYNSVTGHCQTHSVLLKPLTKELINFNWRYYQIYTEDCDPKDDLILYRKENICYFLSDERKSWSAASHECRTRNSQILYVDTKELQNHLAMALNYYFEFSDYLGCYKDASNRAFPKMFTNQKMSIDWCRTTCRKNNYKYAGTQSTIQCFCGNVGYYKHGGSTKCNHHCPVDPNEICGGSWANSVYKSGGEYFISASSDSTMNVFWAPNETGFVSGSCVILDPLQDHKWKNVPCTDRYNFLCGKKIK